MNPAYVTKLNTVATRVRVVLTALRKQAGKDADAVKAVKALESKAHTLRTSVYGLENVLRQAHNIAYVHKLKIV